MDIAMLILMTQYLYYAHRMRRREQLLEDLYSDPDSHSLQWIWAVIAINAGWWVLRFLFGTVDCLRDWMYVAAYLYMTGYILFVFTKVVNYGEPVSLATQKALEKHDNDDVNDDVNDKIKHLKTLMIQRQLYLNSDLTVEDVAKCLNASPKYLSIILHNELHTSFAQFVNGYRVERAKQLLRTTDGKVEYIGALCGFNSRQAFRRIFTLHTGVSPTDFRNQE